MKKPKKARGPKVRSEVVIPADLVAVAKIESAIRCLPLYSAEREAVWRLVGKRMGFTVKE